MTEHNPRRRTVLAAFALIASFALGACGSAAPAVVPSVGPSATAPAVLPLSVSVAETATLRDAGAYIIDVREPSEWATGHIPGATLIPLGEIANRTNEVPRDRTVITVCHTGNRSAQARDILRQAGFTNVTSMTGGMTDWIAAGLPTTTGS